MCLYVRPLATDETEQVAQWAQSYDALTHRRAQIIQLSAQQWRVPAIATAVGCTTRWVRETIHRVNRNVTRIPRQTSPGRPRICAPAQREALIELLHQRPETFGHAGSLWTAADLAATAVARGIVPAITDDTVRTELKRTRRSWQRAKRWSTSPDPQYAPKRASSSAG